MHMLLPSVCLRVSLMYVPVHLWLSEGHMLFWRFLHTCLCLFMFAAVCVLYLTCSCCNGWHAAEVEVKLRPTVSRPVRLDVRHPSGTREQFFFLLEIFFRQLRVCYFVAPSLTTGRICNLLLLLVLASAVPRDSRPYIIVPILETLPTWKARSPYLYPPGTGCPRYTPGHWVSFPSPLTTRRATVEVFYPSSTRDNGWYV
jgi:hypothetical protein